MTGSDVILALAMAAAGVMTVVVVFFAARGRPGMVSLTPPEGSPRWPVYGFFAPWFIAGFAASANGGSRVLLWIRLGMFIVVLIAFVISWWRLRNDPAPPPRA